VCAALAEVIRQRRAASGLSLNRLAELTRLSRPSQSANRRGRCGCKPRRESAVARLFTSGWQLK